MLFCCVIFRTYAIICIHLVLLRTLSFRIRIGGGSGCDPAYAGQDVVAEYQTESSFFHQIIKLNYDGEYLSYCSSDQR